MEVPVGSLVVISSITNNHVTNPHLFKVVKETDKSVEISRLNEHGELVDADKSKTIRKTSIVAVLDRLEDFAPYKKMNDDLNEKWTEYLSTKFEYSKALKEMHSKK